MATMRLTRRSVLERFARDSPLEGARFEPSVPREGIYVYEGLLSVKSRNRAGSGPFRGPAPTRSTSRRSAPARLRPWRGAVSAASLKDVANEIPQADIDGWSIDSDTPVERLRHLWPTARLSETPPHWGPSPVPLGYNEPAWPAQVV